MTNEQYEAGERHLLAGAKPLGQSLTVSDSKGCAWEVIEQEDGVLSLIRYIKPDGTPICITEQ